MFCSAPRFITYPHPFPLSHGVPVLLPFRFALLWLCCFGYLCNVEFVSRNGHIFCVLCGVHLVMCDIGTTFDFCDQANTAPNGDAPGEGSHGSSC